MKQIAATLVLALAQFHREIGKYVDNTELARLEQYVFVPVKK